MARDGCRPNERKSYVTLESSHRYCQQTHLLRLTLRISKFLFINEDVQLVNIKISR